MSRSPSSRPAAPSSPPSIGDKGERNLTPGRPLGPPSRRGKGGPEGAPGLGHPGSLAGHFPSASETWLTPSETAIAQRSVGLVDAIDHLLNRGACVLGEATISLGGVELIYLGLNLVVASVETLRQGGTGRGAGPNLGGPSGPPCPPREGGDYGEGPGLGGGSPLFIESPAEPTAVLEAPPSSPPSRGGQGGPEGPPRLGPPSDSLEAQNGLAQLVLTLVELLRQILERQAVRRMEGDSLSDEEIERMGVALLDLEAKLAELREMFGLSEGDLNLDLGPLGRLL